MSLTKNDLQAIKRLVDDSIDRRVPIVVKPLLDNLDENISQRTAAGFAEVHAKIDGLSEQIEETTIRKIRKVLRAV